MPNLIQSVFLNDLMILCIGSIAMLMLTSWSFRQQEYTGYALGWLIGFFFIVVFSSMISPSAFADTTDENARLSLLTVMAATIFGLITSVVLITGVQLLVAMTRTGAQTWFVTIGVALIVSSGYLMLMSTTALRLIVVIFVLALAIMLLLVWVLLPRRFYSRGEVVTMPDDELLPDDQLSMTSNTVEQIRQLRQRFQQASQREPYP